MITGEAAPVVVIGIGNAMRTDDGLGPTAIDMVAERLADSRDLAQPSPVELCALSGEVTELLDAWHGRELAVVIDAIRVDGRPGSRYRFEVGVDRLPDWGAGTSSHGAGLAEAIAVGRVLDRLPASLVIHGVEPADVSFGEGLSTPVQVAVEPLVDAVIAELTC